MRSGVYCTCVYVIGCVELDLHVVVYVSGIYHSSVQIMLISL